MNAAGTKVVLKGVNVGGWFEWEPWMWGNNALLALQSETDIQTHMTALLGLADADAFTQRVYSEFIADEDFKEIGRVGLNVVRIPSRTST